MRPLLLALIFVALFSGAAEAADGALTAVTLKSATAIGESTTEVVFAVLHKPARQFIAHDDWAAAIAAFNRLMRPAPGVYMRLVEVKLSICPEQFGVCGEFLVEFIQTPS